MDDLTGVWWGGLLIRGLFYYYYLRFYSNISPLCQRHYQTLWPRQKFPYVWKPYLVYHEIHFQGGQPVFSRRWPKVWTIFNRAFFKAWWPNFDLVGFILYTLGINLTSKLMPDNDVTTKSYLNILTLHKIEYTGKITQGRLTFFLNLPYTYVVLVANSW